MVVLWYIYDSQFIFSFGDHEVDHNVDFSGYNIMETIYPYKKDNKHNTLWQVSFTPAFSHSCQV